MALTGGNLQILPPDIAFNLRSSSGGAEDYFFQSVSVTKWNAQNMRGSAGYFRLSHMAGSQEAAHRRQVDDLLRGCPVQHHTDWPGLALWKPRSAGVHVIGLHRSQEWY